MDHMNQRPACASLSHGMWFLFGAVFAGFACSPVRLDPIIGGALSVNTTSAPPPRVSSLPTPQPSSLPTEEVSGYKSDSSNVTQSYTEDSTAVSEAANVTDDLLSNTIDDHLLEVSSSLRNTRLDRVKALVLSLFKALTRSNPEDKNIIIESDRGSLRKQSLDTFISKAICPTNRQYPFKSLCALCVGLEYNATELTNLTSSDSASSSYLGGGGGNVSSPITALPPPDSFFNIGIIIAISVLVVLILAIIGGLGFFAYRYLAWNRPQTLTDKFSNDESTGYIDDSAFRENSEEMYSLDNDSFLNSLEAMTIQNYWTDHVRHTKL